MATEREIASFLDQSGTEAKQDDSGKVDSSRRYDKTKLQLDDLCEAILTRELEEKVALENQKKEKVDETLNQQRATVVNEPQQQEQNKNKELHSTSSHLLSFTVQDRVDRDNDLKSTKENESNNLHPSNSFKRDTSTQPINKEMYTTPTKQKQHSGVHHSSASQLRKLSALASPDSQNLETRERKKSFSSSVSPVHPNTRCNSQVGPSVRTHHRYPPYVIVNSFQGLHHQGLHPMALQTQQYQEDKCYEAGAGNSNNGDNESMECEVYDVDNDVTLIEQHQSPNKGTGNHQPPTYGHQNMDPNHQHGSPMMSHFPGNVVPIIPTRVPHPLYQAYPNNTALPSHTRIPNPAAPTSVVIETGFGPALLLTSAGAAAYTASVANMTSMFNGGSVHASPAVNASTAASFSPVRRGAVPDATMASTNSTVASVRSQSTNDNASKNTNQKSTTDSPPLEVPTRFQRWTEEEDQLLRYAAKQEGPPPFNWTRIAAKYFPNTRTGPQCKARWKKALKPGLKRGGWTQEEDRIILELHHKKGLKFTEIAKHLPGRMPDHIRQRFMNALDPQKKYTPWSEDEVKVLCAAQKLYGNKWAEISKFLPGRSENDIKNRWYNAKTSQRRKIRKMAAAATCNHNRQSNHNDSVKLDNDTGNGGALDDKLCSSTSDNDLSEGEISQLSN